jgi:hypothetical protein
MAQTLSAADRFKLQTALGNAGISQAGAKQLASGLPITDPADRETLALLISSLLSQSQRPAHTASNEAYMKMSQCVEAR